MNNDNTVQLPGEDLKTYAEEEEDKILGVLRSLQVKASDRYDRPEFTLEQDGIGFAPLGNIMAICAEMKNGKTWMMLQLAVALLNGSFGKVKGVLKDVRIMWFDTEQDKYDSMLILRRIHQMCGWAYNTDHPEFTLYNLRDIRFDKRKETVLEGIRQVKPTVVFIDGIRDLVQSVNEEEECYALINDLMTITAQHHCSIWSVLHVNPNTDKMRGHLGTELGNKTTDVFSVKKKKDTENGGYYFTVSHVAARHRDIDGWDFRIRDYPGTPKYSEPEMLAGPGAFVPEDRWQTLHDLMTKYVPEIKAISKTALKEAVARGETISASKAWALVEEAIREGAIEQVIGGKYRLRHNRPENIMEEKKELPF